MAGKTTTTKTNVGKSDTNVIEKKESGVDNSLIVQENAELKKQLLEMQEMMKQFMESQKTAQLAIKTVKSIINDEMIIEEEYPEIPTNKPIRVMSLFNGGLNLKTSNDSSAQVFRLEKVGDILPIIYMDLSKIISNQRRFFEDGLCLIMDKDVVKLHYLEDAMKKILDHKTITNILDYDVVTVKQLVSNTTKSIQQTIVDLLVEKINKNEYIDRNKVSAISEIFGYDIFELANRAK